MTAEVGVGEAPEGGGLSSPQLIDHTVSALRNMIVSGELAPGARLVEREFCEKFGISRTPLREALKVLTFDGLVDLLPNRGARVRSVPVTEIVQILELMQALETSSAAKVCANLTDNALAEIRVLHYQMALHKQRGDTRAYFDTNDRIHVAILEQAGNPIIASCYRSYSNRIRGARNYALSATGRWDASLAEHEQILKALEARDGDRLTEVLRHHISGTMAALQMALPSKAS